MKIGMAAMLAVWVAALSSAGALAYTLARDPVPVAAPVELVAPAAPRPVERPLPAARPLAPSVVVVPTVVVTGRPARAKAAPSAPMHCTEWKPLATSREGAVRYCD